MRQACSGSVTVKVVTPPALWALMRPRWVWAMASSRPWPPAARAGSARERELKITVPETLEYEDAFDDLFERYTDKLELESVKTSGMGSVFELKYRVRMRRDVSHKAFLDALRCRNGNLPIQLCHTDTQEGIL